MYSLFVEEKVLAILRHHYNLYHSDCIMSLLQDENVSMEEMFDHINRIEQAEKNDIDEYDS